MRSLLFGPFFSADYDPSPAAEARGDGAGPARTCRASRRRARHGSADPEQRFDALLSAGEMRDWLLTLSSQPAHMRESLEAREWGLASPYPTVTAKVLDDYRAQPDRITALLSQRERRRT